MQSRLPPSPIPAEDSRERSRTGWLQSSPALIWLGLFYVLPLGVIFAVSFSNRGQPIEWTFSLEAWKALADSLYLEVFLRSAWIAVIATIFCLLIGYPLACYIVRKPPRTRQFLYFLVLIPLSANSVILLFAWISILRNGGILQQFLEWIGIWEGPLRLLYTPQAVVLGLTYWFLPFMVYPIYASLEKLDWRLVEAARDLGADTRTVIKRILIPLSWPGIATGCLLVFLQSLCTFVVSELLGGSKAIMIGNLIQRRFLNQPRDFPLGSALSIILLIVLGLGLWAFFTIQRRKGQD